MPAENEAVRGGGAWDYEDERVWKLVVEVVVVVRGGSRLVVRGSGAFVVEVIVEASSSTYGLFVVRAFCGGETACVCGVDEESVAVLEREPAEGRKGADGTQGSPLFLFLFIWVFVCVCVCPEASSAK